MIGEILGLVAGGIGAAIGSGKKPKLPDFNPVDPTIEQGRAISGNILNFQEASRLSEMTNSKNQEQLMTSLRAAIPNYDELISKSSNAINAGLSGELPKDVANAISKNTAERAIGGGYAGSGMARSLTARDISRTSYDIIQQSINNAQRLVSNLRATSVAPIMGPEAMFLSPSARVGIQFQNNQQAYGAGTASAINNAQADPLSRNIGSMITGFGGMLMSGGFNGIGGSSNRSGIGAGAGATAGIN